jgi:hypothetical protein
MTGVGPPELVPEASEDRGVMLASEILPESFAGGVPAPESEPAAGMPASGPDGRGPAPASTAGGAPGWVPLREILNAYANAR